MKKKIVTISRIQRFLFIISVFRIFTTVPKLETYFCCVIVTKNLYKTIFKNFPGKINMLNSKNHKIFLMFPLLLSGKIFF